jgi:hypothetical protein
MKKGIVFIYKDGTYKYVKSYSYINGYRPPFGETPKPEYIRVNYTDCIIDCCHWDKDQLLESVYHSLTQLLSIDDNLDRILKVNTDLFKRYLKIQKLKDRLV